MSLRGRPGLFASPARFRWTPNSMAWCCICQNFSTEEYAMHMTFDGSGGISIAASLVGDGLGRPPVLLAHGGGQTRRTWRQTMRSEERRVGKECVSTWRYRGSQNH